MADNFVPCPPQCVLDLCSLVSDSYISFSTICARTDSPDISTFGGGVHISSWTIVVAPACEHREKPKVWHWALASGALVASGVVWSPASNIDLSRPQNVDSVTVELSRGPCFGTCAAYTVTAHGDGRVEFVGQVGRSRVQTTKSGTVAKEKVVEILQALDHVDFTALEGRAFFWAFDTPTVGVRASLDGRTKQVVSDASFGGSPDGRQARFVEAARKIDDILASSTWIKCEGQCEGSASSP